MSSGPRYHIPFPTAFLSLNTREQKSVVNRDAAASSSPESELAPHGFLSNRPNALPRHSSISSVASDASTSSTPSSPATQATDAPVSATPVPAFLTLNSKPSAAPAPAKEMTPAEKHNFLSNKH
ncbi:hypothetical protein BS50DRAFT_265092 [Corynespora cassiicola Philippines]|uniref:Uncharacterized protein n=1 Tax=Corynespora cassiicola Philippines TaxID=1448308 RepID=A0A2T2NYX8_CORCC|nr:hypothetical protein BS50DRAFT_265092 [Corynespora cassiicola Philippines]